MDEDKKQIAFRGTEEYRRQVNRAAFDRGLKVQDFIERAIAAYVAEPSGAATEREQRLDPKLQRLLDRIVELWNTPERERTRVQEWALDDILSAVKRIGEEEPRRRIVNGGER